MLIKKLRVYLTNVCSKVSLIITFSLFIFSALLVALSIVAVTIILELHFGLIQLTYLLRPAAGLITLFFLSLIIGGVTSVIASRLLFGKTKPILTAMKQLSKGNFQVRISQTSLLCPKELKEFFEEFNVMAQELESIEILRTDFVSNVSHEFKTPIVSLRGFAKLLQEPDLTQEERAEYLAMILGESDRLSNLSSNMLNLSKIEHQALLSGQTELELSEEIRRAMLIMESKWTKKQLELEMELEDVYYYGNGDLLSQVWINILDNAIKFSPRHGRLEIQLKDTRETVIFRVRDYGCGMDENTTNHMFDKFFQGDKSHTTEGNGLGMAVVQKIVALHGGDLSVLSSPGDGTEVTIVLPKEKQK